MFNQYEIHMVFPYEIYTPQPISRAYGYHIVHFLLWVPHGIYVRNSRFFYVGILLDYYLRQVNEVNAGE